MAIEENPFNHILYEFSMYLQASTLRSDDQFITNLLVDSRMVHMRNLAYFFSSVDDRNKNYLHCSMYIISGIPQGIDRSLFSEVQRITSNSTCHLLKGRLKESFKHEASLFEQRVFPAFVSLIKCFILEMDKEPCSEYASAWADKQIQDSVNGVLELIHNFELEGMGQFAVATTE